MLISKEDTLPFASADVKIDPEICSFTCNILMLYADFII